MKPFRRRARGLIWVSPRCCLPHQERSGPASSRRGGHRLGHARRRCPDRIGVLILAGAAVMIAATQKGCVLTRVPNTPNNAYAPARGATTAAYPWYVMRATTRAGMLASNRRISGLTLRPDPAPCRMSLARSPRWRLEAAVGRTASSPRLLRGLGTAGVNPEQCAPRRPGSAASTLVAGARAPLDRASPVARPRLSGDPLRRRAHLPKSTCPPVLLRVKRAAAVRQE